MPDDIATLLLDRLGVQHPGLHADPGLDLGPGGP